MQERMLTYIITYIYIYEQSSKLPNTELCIRWTLVFIKCKKTEVSDGTFPNSDTPLWDLPGIYVRDPRDVSSAPHRFGLGVSVAKHSCCYGVVCREKIAYERKSNGFRVLKLDSTKNSLSRLLGPCYPGLTRKVIVVLDAYLPSWLILLLSCLGWGVFKLGTKSYYSKTQALLAGMPDHLGSAPGSCSLVSELSKVEWVILVCSRVSLLLTPIYGWPSFSIIYLI